MSEEKKSIGSERVFLRGTEGQEDYLIVGYKEGLAMGVKPLFKPVRTGLGFGVRIRFANAPGKDEDMNVAAYLAASPFGAFAWMKIDDERASAIIAGEIPVCCSDTTDTLLAKVSVAGYIPSMMSGVYENFDLDDPHPKEDVYEFLYDSLNQMLVKVFANKVAVPEDTPCTMPIIITGDMD